jgi:hypothetical protein
VKTNRLAIALSIVAILIAATAVYAVSYTLSSGEWIGLGSAKGRMEFVDDPVGRDDMYPRDLTMHVLTDAGLIITENAHAPVWYNKGMTSSFDISYQSNTVFLENFNTTSAGFYFCHSTIAGGLPCMILEEIAAGAQELKLVVSSENPKGAILNVGDNAWVSSSGPTGGDTYIKVNGPVTATRYSGSTAVWARVYNSTDQSIANATNTALALNGETMDAYGMHDNVTNNTRVYARQDGVYSINGSVAFAYNTTGIRSVDIRVNGSTYIAISSQNAAPAAVTYMGTSATYYLSAGAYVELVAYQNSGGSLNVIRGVDYSPHLSVTRLP